MKCKVIPSIQLLRGIAALAVLLMHTSTGLQIYYDYSFFDQIFSFGHAGVDVFFVISGCIMMYVHRKDIGLPERWGVYMQRRLQRIYPTYWVAFLIPFGVYSYQDRIGTEFSWQMILHSFFLIPQDTRTILVVSWTLVYEMIFYTIFGLLILNKRMGIGCLIIWLGAILFFNAVNWEFPVKQVVDLRNLEFFLGMGVGWLVLHNYRLSVAWQKVSIFLAVLELVWNYFYPSTHPWMVVIPAAVFILAYHGEVQQKLTSWLLYLGTISYSIYLVHVPIMLASYNFLLKLGVQHAIVAFGLSMMFCLLSGVAFYYFIEQKLSKVGTLLNKQRATASSR